MDLETVEITTPTQGNCIYLTVCGALNHFGKTPLHPTQKLAYKNEAEERVAQYSAETGREEGLGDWIIITYQMIAEKLNPYGIEAKELVCLKETADAFQALPAGKEITDKLRVLHGRKGKIGFPFIVFLQNKINPDTEPHVWLCGSPEAWGNRHTKMIPGDDQVLFMKLTETVK